MTATTPLVMRIMALSINTSKKAGFIIREIMQQGNLGIVDKGINDPQTEADRSAQRCIIQSLAKQFPRIQIIGEEGNTDQTQVAGNLLVSESDQEFLKQKCPEELRDVKEEDLCVWVDPLDGTSEYTKGFLDHVTVLIGVAVKDAAVGGIIHQPYYKNASGELGRTIWGLKGLGTGGFEKVAAPSDKFIITTTRVHSNAIADSALEALKPTEVIRVGGAGFKVLQLLDGKAHAYVFATPGCKKWDTCAPEAVLEAQGGTLTDIIGNHYAYNANVEHVNKTGVLATNGAINHSEIVAKIPASVGKTLAEKSGA